MTKKGKRFNKTNDCVVCKKFNMRKWTTFICSTCCVPLCAPVLSEHTKAPTGCFCKYHENIFVSSEFSTARFNDKSSNESREEWFKKKPSVEKKKCDHGLKVAEI